LAVVVFTAEAAGTEASNTHWRTGTGARIMYLGELIGRLDSAISYFERKQDLGRRTAQAMSSPDRQNFTNTLQKMRTHLYRLRCLREALLAERRPGSFLN
jgi:hypothetical protein